MNSKSTLVTVAMLISFLSKAQKDYLDLISPFVLKSLPNKINQKINISYLMENLKNEFGFEDLPINVLRKILNRLSKSKNKFVRKINNEYYLNKVYDSSDFELNRSKISKSLADVINSLKRYFEKNTFEKNITHEKVEKHFINFLEHYGYTVNINFDDLRTLTKDDRYNYNIARFIIDEYEKKSEIYYCILEIVKGFYVYKSIYYFGTDQKKTLDSKLKRTEIYLDTGLIINALGYHLEEDKIATKELLNLIRESNGLLKVFEHTVDEVAGILTKYARDPFARVTMRLDYFGRNAYEEYDVIRLRDSLRLNLKKLNIDIVETPKQDVSSDENLNNRGFIDEVCLKEFLLGAYHQVGKDPREESLDRDVESISAISRLRKTTKNADIESCKAIFATHNLLITKAVNGFFKDRFSKGEISFVIHEMDLTALLWLRSFDKKSDIPAVKLLENAYSAMRPSNELLHTFNEKVRMLEKEGIITEQEALLIRTQQVSHQDLAELSQNDPNNIDSEMIIKIKDNLLEDHV